MQNFYIFRHGETEAVKDHTLYGFHQHSAPILKEGETAIKKLANYLKDIPSDLNISSELERCRETAEIVEEITGKTFTYDRRLNEYYPEEGDSETFPDLIARLEDFLGEMESKNYKTIMICTHGALIPALVALIGGKEVTWREIEDCPDTGVLVEIKEGKVKEINFNS